jgi:transcriptional regulator with XRE-family HTH domain
MPASSLPAAGFYPDRQPPEPRSRLKPAVSGHPLKLLRFILGVSQKELAQQIGISWDTVRSIETGRRELTEERLAQIRIQIGAILGAHKDAWYFDPGGFAGRRIPYVREHYETFRQELKRAARQRALLVYYMTLRFYRLCAAVPDAELNKWFWSMEQLFEQKEREYKIDNDIEVSIEPLWDTEKARTVGYSKFFPDLLRGEEQVFLKMIEEARKEKQQQTERHFPPTPDKQVQKVKGPRPRA